MARTPNPKKIRPQNVNRFRGVTSALTQSAVPDNLTTTQHNLESREIRQLSTRPGIRLIKSDPIQPVPADYVTLVTAESYNGTVYDRYFGYEVEGLAEGTRVHAGLLYPYPSMSAGDFSFNAEFPTFLPPDFPDGPNYDLPTITVPDLPTFVWPQLDPFNPQGPYPDPPPYPLVDDQPDQPDAPDGPREPPGFQPPPSTPCGWSTRTVTRTFRLDLSVTAWQHWTGSDKWQSATGCVQNWCEPGTLNCANITEAHEKAKDYARAVLKFLKARDGRAYTLTESSADCSTLDWTRESVTVTDLVEEFPLAPALCQVPEFPLGTPQSPNNWKVSDYVTTVDVLINVVLEGYKPLALATNMCRIKKATLVWENGYRKTVPFAGSELKTELDGNDLKVTGWKIGTIDDIKTGTDYPDPGPCALDTPLSAYLECETREAIWDCGGAPPPPIKFGS